MHKETDRLIEIVRARLKVPAEAAAFIEADLRGSIATENPPAGQIATLNRRLARGRTLAWVFTLLAAIAVLAASFGSVRTFRLLDVRTTNERLLASLSGDDRLKMAAWIGFGDPHEAAQALLDAEPGNLAARELWIMTASSQKRHREKLQQFVAESERMDPGNGIYQLHLFLKEYQTLRSSHATITPSHGLVAKIDAILAMERIVSRLGELQEDVHRLVPEPKNHMDAQVYFRLLSTFQNQPGPAESFVSAITRIHSTPVLVLPENFGELDMRHRGFLEKSAPFLATRRVVRDIADLHLIGKNWRRLMTEPSESLHRGSWVEITKSLNAEAHRKEFSQFSVTRIPNGLQILVEPLGNLDEVPIRLSILHRAGLTHELVNPLNQMHWAWMDRRMAVHAAWGIIALTILTCFVPLLRGVFTHHAANALQWMMPARDHFFAAIGAWVITVGTAIMFLTIGPRPRVARLDSELDLYFYVPVAAMLLLLVFSFTALFHRRRGRLLGWKGVHPLMLILPIPVAVFSLWAQFAWHGEPRLMRVNASCAGLFGLITMSGLLYHALGDASRTLERTVLIKQFIKSLIVTSLLMSATAGACYFHELHWGKQDRLLNHAHGRPVFFDLRDELLRQSHEYQLQSLRRQP
jgi:hypothetical protein